jgi:hypothetical protein
VLAVDDIVSDALKTHQVGGVRATAFYGGAVTVPVLHVASGSVGFKADGEVQGSGSCTIVGQGPTSLVPRIKTDPLAVYGQELSIRRTILIGGTEYELPLGRFRITEVTGSSEHFRDGHVTDWSVDLRLDDRFEQIKADDFLAVEAPQPGADTWDEIRRLSPIPVQESLPAASVPAGTVYDSRLEALTILCDRMGGLPHLTREGVLTARLKDAWLTASTPVFDIQGVIDWHDGMKNDFYNQVQAKSSSQNELVAYRQITDPANPLAVSRAGGRTYRYSAPTLDSQAAVNAAAETVLRRVSTKRSRPVTVTAGPEALLLELGDYGKVTDTRTGRWAVGEVFSLDVDLDPTSGVGVQLIVAEES